MKRNKFRGTANNSSMTNSEESLTTDQKMAAVHQIEELLAKSPDNPDLLFVLGIVYADLEQYEKALDYLNKFLLLAPNNIPAMHIIASAYQSMESCAEAIYWNRKILSIDPKDLMANWNLAASLFSNHQYEEAILQMEKNAKAQPCDQNAWSVLGHYYTFVGRFQDSYRAFNRAHKISPRNNNGKESQYLAENNTKLCYHLNNLNSDREEILIDLRKAIVLLADQDDSDLEKIAFMAGAYWWLGQVSDNIGQEYFFELTNSTMTIYEMISTHYVALKMLGFAKNFEIDLSKEYYLAIAQGPIE